MTLPSEAGWCCCPSGWRLWAWGLSWAVLLTRPPTPHQEKERQRLEQLRRKEEAEQIRRQKVEEAKRQRLEEVKL